MSEPNQDRQPAPSLERRAVRAILAGTDLPPNHARQLVGQLSDGEQTTLAALGPRAVPAWLAKRFPPPAKEQPAEPAAVEPAPPAATADEPKPAAEVRRRK